MAELTGLMGVKLPVADLQESRAWYEMVFGARPYMEFGWLVVLHDVDGHEIHLYTDQRHDIDHAGRPGYGRPVAGSP